MDAAESAAETPPKRLEQKKAKFRSYFYALYLLAELGLDGPQAQPLLAKIALSSLKDQILALEGGRIKNSYMRRLGAKALVFSVPPSVVLFAYELKRYFDLGHLPALLTQPIVRVAITLLFPRWMRDFSNVPR